MADKQLKPNQNQPKNERSISQTNSELNFQTKINECKSIVAFTNALCSISTCVKISPVIE